MKKTGLIIAFCLLLHVWAKAQPCGTAISSFPYNETFEANNGGWVAGGTSSDWAWGHPAKSIINAAAEGTNCWIAGGLSNSTYNSGENSWLMSPCFDFSSLVHPEISFNIFWETEKRFDGASFQYSIDGGTNWTLLGSSNTNNCDINHWYNTDNITYLGGTMGWSGSVKPNSGNCLGGDGVGSWATAKHPLNMLAGQPNVRFRFRFGAGTQCNTFDGFAVDNIFIKEAEAPAVAITSLCSSDGSSSFTVNSNCITDYRWNFGDPSTGAGNTSSLPDPRHLFSAPGTYTVTLVATFATGVSVTRTQAVAVLAATKTIVWPGACTNTPDATFTVNPTGSNTPYFYYWETNPPQTTQTITNMPAGNWSVIVSSENACPIRLQFGIAPGLPVPVNPVITNAACNNNNGSVITNVTGANAPYTYLWSNGATTSAIYNLSPGNYSLKVTDVFGCPTNAGPYTIINDNNISVSLGPDRNICPGQSITLSPGLFASYKWQDGSTGTTLTVSAPGTYYVDVVDALGCTASDTIQITSDCSEVYFPSAFSPNNDTRNDLFGPLGNVTRLENYSLRIFNRYGQLVFYSTSPLQKWDGSFKGSIPQNGSYVWMASYTLNGRPVNAKGSVLMIR